MIWLCRFRSFLTIMGLCCINAAQAQEFEQEWHGFYAGIHADVSMFDVDMADLNNQFNSNAPKLAGIFPHGGVSAGYNYLFRDKLILGAEIDYTSRTEIIRFISSNATGSAGTQINTALEGIISARFRAGLQHQNAMAYLTGGYSSATPKFETFQVDTSGGKVSCTTSKCASTNEPLQGISLGAGLEYAFWENVLARFEVQHYLFDELSVPVLDSLGASACGGGETDLCAMNYSPSVTSLRLGVSYKF